MYQMLRDQTAGEEILAVGRKIALLAHLFAQHGELLFPIALSHG